jgi:hypothetical protein
VTWEGDEIPAGLLSTGLYGDEEACEVAAESYGWTPENHRKFSINMMGLETKGYDGVSYWLCLKCHTFIDRFTGQEYSKEEAQAVIDEQDFIAIHAHLGEIDA